MRIIITEKQLRFLVESQTKIDWNTKKIRKRAPHSDILFLSPSKILERVGQDMPDFDIRRQGVRIGDRLEKAKEYLMNVEANTFEATNVYVEWWKWGDNREKINFDKPKIGIADGRHRLLAAFELGLDSFPIEVYSHDEIEQKKSVQYLKDNFAPEGKENVIMYSDEKKDMFGGEPSTETSNGNSNQEVINKIMSELKYVKGNFEEYLKPNFEKFVNGDMELRRMVINNIAAVMMYLNKVDELLKKIGKGKDMSSSNNSNTDNPTKQELLNKFSSIKLYFDTFFNNDFSITSLNGFLSMAIPNLKLLAKSVINFDI
jgi:hypothetical protein